MSGTATHVTVRVPLTIQRRPGRMTVVTPVRDGSEATLPTQADPALVKALARAFRYQKLLNEGRYASISEMAEAERIEQGHLGSLLRLTLLAPEIVEAVMNRRDAAASLTRLVEPLPLAWTQRRDQLGVG